jgi:hypothetical protein
VSTALLAALPAAPVRLTADEAATRTRRHRVTVYRALEDGSLHGTQRVKGGRWTVRAECADAWADGMPCEHQAAQLATVTDLNSRRVAS